MSDAHEVFPVGGSRENESTLVNADHRKQIAENIAAMIDLMVEEPHSTVQTPPEQIAELRERVTRLEQQNAELTERLVAAVEAVAEKIPTRDWLEGLKRSITKK